MNLSGREADRDKPPLELQADGTLLLRLDHPHPAMRVIAEIFLTAHRRRLAKQAAKAARISSE